MDLAGTRDIFPHSGTVPGNPGHMVTLHSTDTVPEFHAEAPDADSKKLKF